MTASNNKQSYRLGEIVERVGGSLDGDGDVRITGVAPIEDAGEGDISFVANTAYEKHIESTGASALVLNQDMAAHGKPVIRHRNPYLLFSQIIDLFYPDDRLVEPGLDATAAVHESAEIADSAGIGPLCDVQRGAKIGANTELVSSVFVGEDVEIGQNCRLYPGVRIMAGCKIGNNVILHPGVVIGSDGFGFAESDKGLKKIKQVGWVEIGDDVEIGSNTTVDRGAMGPTRIGRGTKIDNLVQIAHNVQIGQHCIIVSQVGISGSTKLGNGVVLAGQVGVVGHIELGDGVLVGAKSGVPKSVPAGKKIFGYPARDMVLSAKIEAAQTRLPDLLKRVRALEKKVDKD